MAVSDEFLFYVIDQLDDLGCVTSRRMFGGAGLYFEDVFFAIVADDVLYFKVDDTSRPDYEAAGMGPFCPFQHKPTVMSYYEVPSDVLEDHEQLCAWARKAMQAAKPNT